MTWAEKSHEEKIHYFHRRWKESVFRAHEAVIGMFDTTPPRECEWLLNLVSPEFEVELRQMVAWHPRNPWDELRLRYWTNNGIFSYSSNYESWISRFRDYYDVRGEIPSVREELPTLDISLEEIMELEDGFSPRGKHPLSERVALHVLGWRMTEGTWERLEYKSESGNREWTPCDPPFFHDYIKPDSTAYVPDGQYVGLLWEKLTKYHPWVRRDHSGKAIRWADVCMTLHNLKYARLREEDSLMKLEQIPSVVVLRESNELNVPEHPMRVDYRSRRWDFTDMFSAIRNGRSFRIPGHNFNDVLCRALLIAKKCREDDMGPDGQPTKLT